MDSTTDLKLFNQLFQNYQNRFIRFAYNYVRDLSIAEDYVMESFMYYWENRNSLDPHSNAPAYILTVIKHKCLNHMKREQLHQGATDKMQELADWELNTRISTLQACNPEELFSVEIQKIVDETLNMLPDRTRIIFTMSRYQNKSHKEIAQEFEISTKGVEFHIDKALKTLRKSLKDYFSVFIYLFM